MDNSTKPSSFTLNIVTASQESDLYEELLMLKAAILYGDRVTFNSFRGSIITGILGNLVTTEDPTHKEAMYAQLKL